MSVHSGRIARWLGEECAEQTAKATRGFKTPVAVMGVPGRVYARDGEFVGALDGGYYWNLADYSRQRWNRIWREYARRNRHTMHGFSSLSDLINEATAGGKAQDILFQKAATTATTVGNAFVARNVGNLPAARGTGGTSGTGVKTTRTTTGALVQANAAAGDTLHVTNIWAQASAVSSLLLFDCLWDMTYNHATSTSTAIDSANRPDRYQTAGLAPGNFVSGEITTALSATAHNLTVTYVDQDGNTAEAAAAYAAPVSAVAGRTPTVAGQWFVPLNSPDTGARYLTNIAQSTITSVTGVTTWFIGHPLAMIPIPIANLPFIFDGINSAFNLARIYDDACLSFMTPAIATTGTITYNGLLRLVSG